MVTATPVRTAEAARPPSVPVEAEQRRAHVRPDHSEDDGLAFVRGLVFVAIPVSLLIWAGLIAGIRNLLW